jgi:hypothetical protein
MSIPVPEVVLDGVYAAPDRQERIVRDIVNGKVVFDVRDVDGEAPWSPGHSLDDMPLIEDFADECLAVTSKPERYSSHDTV